jgi:hypothetical protein
VYKNFYLAFHGFEQAKFADGGSILGLCQFTRLPLQGISETQFKKGQN